MKKGILLVVLFAAIVGVARILHIALIIAAVLLVAALVGDWLQAHHILGNLAEAANVYRA